MLDAGNRRYLAAMAGFYLRQQRYDRAATLLEVLHLMDIQETRYRLLLAFCLISLKQHQRGIALLEPLLKNEETKRIAGRLHCRALWLAGHEGAAMAMMGRYGLRAKEAGRE